MKNRKHAEGAPDKARVAGELDDGAAGSLHQQGISRGWSSAGTVTVTWK